MSLPHVTPPVRRGPGRPRKQPAPPSLTSFAPLIGAEMPQPRLLAVLKCHAPDGMNVANVLLYADGRVVAHGEESLAWSALRQMAKALPVTA